jgi:hypothetical protein
MTDEARGLLIRKGNLGEGEEGSTILIGFLDLLSSIDNLNVSWYQRAAGFSQQKIRQLANDLRAGDQMPPIVLGMRGDQFDVLDDGTIKLRDPVYIIDGLQRWFAALSVREQKPGLRLAVMVYLNTAEEIEIALFRKLNTKRTGVSPSIHIRNEKNRSRVAATLCGLSTNQPDFALFERIAWDQRFDPDRDLLSGATLFLVLTQLHVHILRVEQAFRITELLTLVDTRIDHLGLQKGRENLIHFFDVVDELWGIRAVSHRHGTPHLKQGWLLTLAKLFSDFTEFWDKTDKTLFVSAALKRDLERLDPKDDEFVRLATGTKTARELLYQLFVQRLNKGRTNKLIDRYMKKSLNEAAE